MPIPEGHVQVAFDRLLRLRHLQSLRALRRFCASRNSPSGSRFDRRLGHVEEGQRGGRL